MFLGPVMFAIESLISTVVVSAPNVKKRHASIVLVLIRSSVQLSANGRRRRLKMPFAETVRTQNCSFSNKVQLSEGPNSCDMRLVYVKM